MKIETGENNPILRQKAAEVTEIDDNIKKIIGDMKKTLKKSNGVGLAAPQIGKGLRIFILSIPKKIYDKPYPKIFINPVLVERSAAEKTMEEGCLSLPGIYGEVSRAKQIKIRAADENGKGFELETEDILARVIQHEYDHLEGILFIDRAKKIQRLKPHKNEL